MYEFADKVYIDAKMLGRYEKSNKITNEIILEHKKYDLLRTLLWLNAINLKEKCGENKLHTIVYLYDYQTTDLTERNEQLVISNYLEELKNKNKMGFILIPIAKNLNISSLDLLLSDYNITKVSIIVDEKEVISDIENLEKIEGYLS